MGCHTVRIQPAHFGYTYSESSSASRIERLLIATSVAGATDIDPRTSGLLLLSTTHLRSYAERRLPANSRLHDGFLEDVTDLEDPALGRKEKLRVVDQMWKSWGQALGWYEIADKQ